MHFTWKKLSLFFGVSLGKNNLKGGLGFMLFTLYTPDLGTDGLRVPGGGVGAKDLLLLQMLLQWPVNPLVFS